MPETPSDGRTSRYARQANWKQPQKRILLYADIMGFKELVDHDPRLHQRMRDFVVRLTKLLKPMNIAVNLHLSMFSDLVVIAAKDNSLKSLNQIVKAATALLTVCYDTKFHINGCITCETLAVEEISEPDNGRSIKMTLFHGKSVINAHLLTEQLFCYGIVADTSMEHLLRADAVSLKSHNHPFSFVPIPLKDGSFARLNYLCWPKVPNPQNPRNARITMASYAHRLLHEELSATKPRVRAYMRNTLEVLKRC